MLNIRTMDIKVIEEIEAKHPDVRLVVVYDPRNGECIPDYYMQSQLDFILNEVQEHEGRHYVYFGNEPMVNKTRLLVVRGLLKPEEIIYIWNNTILTINEYGAWVDCPIHVTSPDTETCIEILRFACNKRKEERKIGG
jgi:hypothetical protein